MPPNLSEVGPNLKKISSNCQQRTRIIKQFDYMFNANLRSPPRNNPTANHKHNNRLASTNFFSMCGHIRARSGAQCSPFCSTFWLENLTSQPIFTRKNAEIWEKTRWGDEAPKCILSQQIRRQKLHAF